VSGSTQLSAAYLLHYAPHRDTSFIVDLFSLDSGLVSVYARGARSGKHRALYQPFRPLYVSWTGDSELKTLTGIEASAPPMSLNDTAMACAYYFNELLLRLLAKNVAQSELFGHYLVALTTLKEDKGTSTAERLANLEPCLRLFELQLLETLGVAPDFGYCANDQSAPEPDRRYRFYPSLGRAAELFPEQPEYDPYDIHREALIRNDAGIDVAGTSLIALSRGNVDEAAAAPDIKRIMRPLLRIQLGDRPLKSRRYFESIMKC